MHLSKADRSAVREKFGGRCAYCGATLGDRWHADHVEPVFRAVWLRPAGQPAIGRPDRHRLDNINPACPPCNIDKSTHSIESWRQLIQRSNEILKRDASAFRRAHRFGLIEILDTPVVFYFERPEEPR